MYNLENISEKVAPDFVKQIQNDEERVLYCGVELTDFNEKSGKSKVRRMPSRWKSLAFSVNSRNLYSHLI